MGRVVMAVMGVVMAITTRLSSELSSIYIFPRVLPVFTNGWRLRSEKQGRTASLGCTDARSSGKERRAGGFHNRIRRGDRRPDGERLGRHNKTAERLTPLGPEGRRFPRWEFQACRLVGMTRLLGGPNYRYSYPGLGFGVTLCIESTASGSKGIASDVVWLEFPIVSVYSGGLPASVWACLYPD